MATGSNPTENVFANHSLYNAIEWGMVSVEWYKINEAISISIGQGPRTYKCPFEEPLWNGFQTYIFKLSLP
jgi:hypothetical protein